VNTEKGPHSNSAFQPSGIDKLSTGQFGRGYGGADSPALVGR